MPLRDFSSWRSQAGLVPEFVDAGASSIGMFDDCLLSSRCRYSQSLGVSSSEMDLTVPEKHCIAETACLNVGNAPTDLFPRSLLGGCPTQARGNGRSVSPDSSEISSDGRPPRPVGLEECDGSRPALDATGRLSLRQRSGWQISGAEDTSRRRDCMGLGLAIVPHCRPLLP